MGYPWFDEMGDPGAPDWHHPGIVVHWMVAMLGGIGYIVMYQWPYPEVIRFRLLWWPRMEVTT